MNNQNLPQTNNQLFLHEQVDAFVLNHDFIYFIKNPQTLHISTNDIHQIFSLIQDGHSFQKSLFFLSLFVNGLGDAFMELTNHVDPIDNYLSYDITPFLPLSFYYLCQLQPNLTDDYLSFLKKYSSNEMLPTLSNFRNNHFFHDLFPPSELDDELLLEISNFYVKFLQTFHPKNLDFQPSNLFIEKYCLSLLHSINHIPQSHYSLIAELANNLTDAQNDYLWSILDSIKLVVWHNGSSMYFEDKSQSISTHTSFFHLLFTNPFLCSVAFKNESRFLQFCDVYACMAKSPHLFV